MPVSGRGKPVLVIGEAVWGGVHVQGSGGRLRPDGRALCPLELTGRVLDAQDIQCTGEVEISREMEKASLVIADPLYRGVLPQGVPFLDSRRKDIPDGSGERDSCIRR